MPERGTRRFSRTLEFDRAQPLNRATLSVSGRLGFAGNAVRLHQGHRSRVCDLLTPTDEYLRDRFAGTFYYADAVCHAAERSGDVAMIPLLSRLRYHGSLRDQVNREGIQPDFFQERQAMLELGIARALARCGSPEGFEVLISYLDDVRALLAEPAHSELIDLTGEDLGKDVAAWRAHLMASGQPMSPPDTAVTVAPTRMTRAGTPRYA